MILSSEEELQLPSHCLHSDQTSNLVLKFETVAWRDILMYLQHYHIWYEVITLLQRSVILAGVQCQVPQTYRLYIHKRNGFTNYEMKNQTCPKMRVSPQCVVCQLHVWLPWAVNQLEYDGSSLSLECVEFQPRAPSSLALALLLQTQGPAFMTQPFGLEAKSHSYGHRKMILLIKMAQCFWG